MAGRTPLARGFGRRRRELDLTQEELARRVGCARITIRKIEAEQLRPSKQMAELLREHLGVPSGESEGFPAVCPRRERRTRSVEPTYGRHTTFLCSSTSFVGRDRRNRRSVRRLLERGSPCHADRLRRRGQDASRLAGGCARSLDPFKDGVWFIELAPLSDPALVPTHRRLRVGRPRRARPATDGHAAGLAAQQAVAIDAGQLRAFDRSVRQRWRMRCCMPAARHASWRPVAKHLALPASRRTGCRRLNVPGPRRRHQLPIEQLEHFPAVQLFIERATQALATFKVTNANMAAITQICHRLDGIPLAIELAAARVKALSVEQIAARLDDRLGLLTGGSRTALPRHQTLRATIDWSHNLLSEPERLLFRRLSVFTGGWTLEAAEQICAGDGIEPPGVLDLLSHLVDKSLVVLDEPAAEPRYRMLETIRQYAREKLLEANEGECTCATNTCTSSGIGRAHPTHAHNRTAQRVDAASGDRAR